MQLTLDVVRTLQNPPRWRSSARRKLLSGIGQRSCRGKTVYFAIADNWRTVLMNVVVARVRVRSRR